MKIRLHFSLSHSNTVTLTSELLLQRSVFKMRIPKVQKVWFCRRLSPAFKALKMSQPVAYSTKRKNDTQSCWHQLSFLRSLLVLLIRNNCSPFYCHITLTNFLSLFPVRKVILIILYSHSFMTLSFKIASCLISVNMMK